jgi:hypothetical protein
MNPADAAALDLLRESGTPDLFVLPGGYQHGLDGSNNIFGPTVPRVVSPRVPVGKAIYGDWSKIRVFLKGGTWLMWDPFTGFATNTTIARAEFRVGLGFLRPDSMFVVTL